MNLKLEPTWQRILLRAWSVRLALIAGALSALETILPYFEGVIPRGWLAAASFFVTILAVIARLVAQPRSLPNEKADA